MKGFLAAEHPRKRLPWRLLREWIVNGKKNAPSSRSISCIIGLIRVFTGKTVRPLIYLWLENSYKMTEIAAFSASVSTSPARTLSRPVGWDVPLIHIEAGSGMNSS